MVFRERVLSLMLLILPLCMLRRFAGCSSVAVAAVAATRAQAMAPSSALVALHGSPLCVVMVVVAVGALEYGGCYLHASNY